MTELSQIPNAKEMEEAVIACIMIEPNTIYDVADILTPEMFYDPLFEDIFAFMLKAVKEQRSWDYVSVGRYLSESGKGSAIIRLSKITNKIVSTAMIAHHATLIKEKYLLRRYLRLAGEINGAVGSGADLLEVSILADNTIMELSGSLQKKEPVVLSSVIDTVIADIGKIQSKEIKLSGVPSGFTDIDRVTGGWKKGELIIIAARPSIGKSALAAQLAFNAATFGENVAIFSLEMSSEEVARRYLSGATGMTNTQLLTGNCLSIEKLFEKTSKFVNLGIYIDDTGAMTLLEVKAKARRLILKYGIRLLIIDYLQLMRGTNTRNREQEVSELSRGLKSVAKELGIPVIVLSQLNRECEARANKKPILSDLRDSGAIEQDADIVLMLSRPAYYGNETININGKVIDTKGVMVVDIAKNRNGGTGDILLRHNEALTIITDDYDNEITPF